MGASIFHVWSKNVLLSLTGKVGDWQRHLSQSQVADFEEWERKHLEGSDLKFSYTLPAQGDVQ